MSATRGHVGSPGQPTMSSDGHGGHQHLGIAVQLGRRAAPTAARSPAPTATARRRCRRECDRRAERDAADRQPCLRAQVVAEVALRRRGQLVGQRRPGALHGVLEVAERLLARLHLLGQREVQEVIVVESAERAAERVEPVAGRPSRTAGPRRRTDRAIAAARAAQRRADDRPSNRRRSDRP